MLCSSTSFLGALNDETLVVRVEVLESFVEWVQGLFLENGWGLLSGEEDLHEQELVE